MKFEQVVEQSDLINQIQSAWDQGNLPHAMLVQGEHGLGSFQFVWAISQWIFCEEKKDTDSCGICPNCKRISKLQHPDLHLFFPTEKSGVEVKERMLDFRKMAIETPIFDIKDWMTTLESPNKSANINKDIIKEITSSFDFKSYLGGPRIVIIWAADSLGKEGNKLLKMIEEPPKNSFIFLIAEEKENILLTIRSRCQTLELKPISQKGIASYLEKPDYDLGNLEQMVDVSNGNIVEVIRLLEGGYDDIAALWLSFLRASFRGNGPELITLCNDIGAKSKEELRGFIKYGLLYTQAILKTKVGLPVAGFNQVDKLAPYLSMDRVYLLAERLEKDYYHVARNANSKVLIGALGWWVNELFH